MSSWLDAPIPAGCTNRSPRVRRLHRERRPDPQVAAFCRFPGSRGGGLRRVVTLLLLLSIASCGTDSGRFVDVPGGATACGFRPNPSPGFKLVEFRSAPNNEIPEGQHVFAVVSDSPDLVMPETASQVLDTSSFPGVAANEIEDIWAQTLSVARGAERPRLVPPIEVATGSCAASVSVQHSSGGLFSKAEQGRDWYLAILEQPLG